MPQPSAIRRPPRRHQSVRLTKANVRKGRRAVLRPRRFLDNGERRAGGC